MTRNKIQINGKRMLLSRFLMEKKLGRELTQYEEVHHKDENPLNDDINNLEVVDRRFHRAIHMWENDYKKGKPGLKGSIHPNTTLTEEKVKEIKRYLRLGIYTQIQISQIFKVNKQTINDIHRGRRWSHVQ